jgi:hypothetical protein
VDSIAQYAWLMSAAGLTADILGFAILMLELAAAQRTEFRAYNVELVAAIDSLRSDLLEFLNRVYLKLKELIPEQRNPYHALRELLDIYFTDRPREQFDEFVAMYNLVLDNDDDIGMVEKINFVLAVAEASTALGTLEQDRMVEGLSDIEKGWFAEWYPLPKLEKGSAIRWYQDESWGRKKPRWLSDNYVGFRNLA